MDLFPDQMSSIIHFNITVRHYWIFHWFKISTFKRSTVRPNVDEMSAAIELRESILHVLIQADLKPDFLMNIKLIRTRCVTLASIRRHLAASSNWITSRNETLYWLFNKRPTEAAAQREYKRSITLFSWIKNPQEKSTGRSRVYAGCVSIGRPSGFESSNWKAVYTVGQRGWLNCGLSTRACLCTLAVARRLNESRKKRLVYYQN